MSARSSGTRGTWKGERSPVVTSVHVRIWLSGGGVPASAAGVDQGGEAARPHLAVALQQITVGHHDGGTRVLEHVGHLGRSQARVHGDGHAAGPMGGRVRDEPAQGQLGTQMNADPGSGLETGLDEPAGHGVGRAVPLGEGHGPDVDDGEGRLVAELLGHAGQVIVHQHCEMLPRKVKVDAGVRFAAAWPMRPRGSIRAELAPRLTAAFPSVAGPGPDPSV